MQPRDTARPPSYSSGPISVIEFTQSGAATLDEHGELHMEMVQVGLGGTTAAASSASDAPPPEQPRCMCPRVCYASVTKSA